MLPFLAQLWPYVATFEPKFKWKILNLFIKTGNHTNTLRALSTPLLPMGAISSAIDIKRKLVTINPKLKGMNLNLFISLTGKDYSLVVNSTVSIFFSLD